MAAVVVSVSFAMAPWLQPFGELVAPLTVTGAPYVCVFASCLDAGTGSGSQFFFSVGGCIVVLLGIERIVRPGIINSPDFQRFGISFPASPIFQFVVRSRTAPQYEFTELRPLPVRWRSPGGLTIFVFE